MMEIAREQIKQPKYMPQPGDDAPKKIEGKLDPTGPWAMGKVSYSPIDGLTGLRPVSALCNINVFGPANWRKRNQHLFDRSKKLTEEAE